MTAGMVRLFHHGGTKDTKGADSREDTSHSVLEEAEWVVIVCRQVGGWVALDLPVGGRGH